jgi:DNA polymerase I
MALPLPDAPRVIRRFEDIERLVQVYTSRGTPVSFDIETTGLDPRQHKLVMIQFQQQGRPVIVIDYRYLVYYRDSFGIGVDGDAMSFVSGTLEPLFTGSVLIVGHNLKFDLGFLRAQLGITANRVYDTMIAEQIIHGVGKSDARNSGVGLTLKSLSAAYDLGEMSKEERSWFIDLDQKPEWDEPFPVDQLLYGARDVEVLQPIADQQKAILRERNLIHVAQLEMRTIPALVEVEHAGVHVDVDGWRAFIEEKRAEAAELEQKALETFGPPILAQRQIEYDIALQVYQDWEMDRDYHIHYLRTIWEDQHEQTGFPGWGAYKNANMQMWREQHPNPGRPKPDTSIPNLGSPKQMQVAFERLGIPATGTGKDVLKELEDDYPAVKLLTTWRKAEKFVTSFGEALLQFVDPTTGRIHPEYVQIGASTGRMACSRPNWQQVPSQGDGARLRALVKAEPGSVILTADFSNIELRILADMSGDARMLESFASGLDLHGYTARMMFGLEEQVDVKHEEAFPGVTYRAVAKTINFGLVYGMSATKLSRTLKISREKAIELFDAYFSLYPGVQKWLEHQRQYGIDHLASHTYAGRVRYYKLPPEPPRPASRDTAVIEEWMEQRRQRKALKHRIERQACNTPVQGTSADITKLALVLLHESLHGDSSLRDVVRVIAIVHDELVVEVPEQLADEVSRLLAESMQAAASTYLHTVTLPPVEVAVSDHWSKE